MTQYSSPIGPGRSHRALAAALLGSVSVLTLAAAGGPAAARNLQSMGIVAPAVAALAAQQAAAAQAAAAGQQARVSLSRAAAALQAMRDVQQAARAAALLAPTSVPDGLAKLGLMPLGGTASDPLAGIKAGATVWIGAGTPTQARQGNKVIVDINQQQKKAILTWETFNVGLNTTVNFNQGGTDWTALNRVDAGIAPSQILGHINALGGVYVINRNGIIFGAGSQINVHSLVASDLDVGKLGSSTADRNQFFLNTGIANGSIGISAFSNDFPSGPKIDSISFALGQIGGGVEVMAGASITASVVSPDSPGFVYLFGANVANHGTISAPAGQVAMVAAQAITLTPGKYQAATFSPSVLPDPTNFRGTGFQIQQYAAKYRVDFTPLSPTYAPGTGLVTHDGLIETPRGIVVMNGDQITIDRSGVISADTSITRNSMVLLDAATRVTMNGTISIQADQNGETLPLLSGAATGNSGSTVQSFTPAFVEMSGQLNVALGSSGLVSAPSASVSLYAATKSSALTGSNSALINPSDTGPQRVLLASGAVIDVAGLQDVVLPASYNFIPFQPRGLEFADMPLQRNGALFAQTLWIDIRASGTRSDGSTWVGTPLADASGFVGQVGRSISQLMTRGGSVSLNTDLTAVSTATQQSVVLADGAVINMAGGNIRFLPGMVPTTRLLGSDGRIYSMANADPNVTYLGIAGQFTVNHAHWGVTETWSSLTQTFEQGYTEGHDAGGLAVVTFNPVLPGTLLFGSVAGGRQIQAGLAPSVTGGPAPTQAKGDELPSQGYLQIKTPSSVIIGANGPPALPAGFGVGSDLPPPANPDPVPSANFQSNSPYRIELSANRLSGYGLSALSVTSTDLVLAAGSTLRLADGGKFSVLTAGAIDIAGTATAAGGQVDLRTDEFGLSGLTSQLFGGSGIHLSSTNSGHFDIFVGGAIDVSGRWVNDIGRSGTDASGPGFINGGTISLATNNSAANGDTTGSILLAQGSLLDVSSGGYISRTGAPKTVASGATAGRAGSVSLRLYQGIAYDPLGILGPQTPLGGSVARLQLDGTLRGYGFQSNGTLTLGAPNTIQIGGAPPVSGDGLYLPASLFNDGGFGAYVIESTPDGRSGTFDSITVAASVRLTLRQQNLVSTADDLARPTGTKIATAAPLTTLPDAQRAPVNLSLEAGNILLDANSSIVTDPKARVTLAGTPDATESDPSKRATTRSSNVLLLGSIVDHGGDVVVNAQKTWLGPQAVIDLSGTFVADTRFPLPNGPAVNGTLLSGGTFTVDAADHAAAGSLSGSYLVAQSGARVDVSGAAGTILVRNHGNRDAPTQVAAWSDAGTVSVNAGAFVWGGSFEASARDPRANGGTILLGGGPVALLQTSGIVTDALANIGTPTDPAALGSLSSLGPVIFNNTVLASSFDDHIVAAVDKLAAFDNVYLYSGTAAGGAGRIFTDLPGNTYKVAAPILTDLTVVGSVDLRVASRLHIAASRIASITPGSTVSLVAPYVNLTGGGGTTPGGSSTLTVTGQTIDIEGAALAGFAQVTFASSGDIRLSTPKVADGFTGTGTLTLDTSRFTGRLAAAGDLTLSAQRIYPVSAVDFSIETGGTVTFTAPAASRTDIPLSAGGSLTVLAPTIEQDGHLFAPLGAITLGGSGTKRVTLGTGSLTSVSLDGTVVPYGETQDGVNWFYNAILHPLTQPGAKSLSLVGQNVVLSTGSTVDVRGGGDLQAMEFIAGKGGSHDVLTTASGGQTVYALLPSSMDAVAAFDVHFTTARSATGSADAYPLAGTQIHIDGGNGIAAGTYTLYPAHYATLPGAMRVAFYGSNLGRDLPTGTTLPDGTVLVSGHYTSSTGPGTQSSGSSLFAIQSSAVWQQYSQYAFTGANKYFAQKGLHDGVAVPRLPMDAGRLAVVSLPTLVLPGAPPPKQSITLDGTALTQAAPGGRGSELDLSAGRLVVSPKNPVGVSSAYPASDNWVWIPVSQINDFGFESVLIGGLRSEQTGGTLITPTADQVVIDTHGSALTAPEILLVAQPSAVVQLKTQVLTSGGASVTVVLPILTPTPGGGSVTIKSGSVIETTGVVHTGFGRNYFFAKPTDITADILANSLGGTVSADGTTIQGVDPKNVPLIFNGALYLHGLNNQPHAPVDFNDPVQVNALVKELVFTPSGAYTPAAAAIFYSYGINNNPGVGALFAASNDRTLNISGPTGTPSAPLNIQFALGTQVLGSITLPGKNLGTVSIDAGARVSTQSLTLQATAQTKAITIDPAATINAKQVNLTARTIGIRGAGAAATGGLLLSPENLAQLSGAQGLTLKAMAGGITFFGDVAFDPGPTMQHLVMDANAITGTGGSASINIGGTITLLNSGAAPAAPAPGVAGSLTLAAAEIDLAGGSQTIAGFGQVNLTASDKMFISAPGALTLGSGTDQVGLSLNTPNILVGGQTGKGAGAQFLISTLGSVNIARPAGGPVEPNPSAEIGGNFAITAASIVDTGTIQAQAGTVTLRATTGDVKLDGALIAAGGYKKTLFDAVNYVSGGKVVLQADAGNVIFNAASLIDVAQPTGGLGYGGGVTIKAAQGSATLLGSIKANGAPGLGGSFTLDTKGAADLDLLANLLLAAGASGTVDIHTHTGNLELLQGHSLIANNITLTADHPAGQVTIAGYVDARGYGGTSADGSGQAGGQVKLYGAKGVTLTSTGVIDASTSHADERGGDVTIGIPWGAAGTIDLQAGSVIYVSGGTKGGLSGGTVTLRAPLDGHNGVKISEIKSTITGARALTVEGFVAFSTNGIGGIDGSTLGWDGIIDPLGANSAFYTTTLASVAQGTFTNGGHSYGFGNVFAMLAPLAQQLGSGVVHVRPGIELVNPDTTINNGDITVKNNWNLAAGTAYNADGTVLNTGGTFNANSSVQFIYRLATPFGAAPGAFGIEPGALTLRAAGNINVNASISDGFFQFRNYLDLAYLVKVRQYLADHATRGLDPNPNNLQQDFLYYLNSFDPNAVPKAPYSQIANSVSPDASALAAADLFPNTLNVVCTAATCGTVGAATTQVTAPGSWSYRFTAGADVTSANPSATQSFASGQTGDVVVDGHSTYKQPLLLLSTGGAQTSVVSVTLPTMVRTGAGNITIAAARDVVLKDQSAPGVIYAAGVSTPNLLDAGYHQLPDGSVVATNAGGFLEPQVLMYSGNIVDSRSSISPAVTVFGPPTAAAFPYRGGDVEIVAQRDIVGNGNPSTIVNFYDDSFTTLKTLLLPSNQHYSPWLLSDVALSGNSLLGQGVFAPNGTSIASQTSWWIQYGSFQQGILSAGGNVTLSAGRDLRDVSVSLPTTGRVSGGLSATDTPITHVYDSGNMVVRAGGDILGGSFYEGSGHASIVARGSVGQNGTLTRTVGNPLPNVPLFAVDSGQISVIAGGSISTAGVVNPAELHVQSPASANPDTSFTNALLRMDTYGPNSGVSLLAIAGDLNIRGDYASTYPASFEAIALSGNITTDFTTPAAVTGGARNPGIVLSGSTHGAFQLLAQGSIDLSGGLTPGSVLAVPEYSTGPALLDTAFDPFRANDGFDGSLSKPLLNNGFDGSSSTPVVAQQTARIYAVTGDITGVGCVGQSCNAVAPTTSFRRIEINRPARIIAGRDIVDLNLIVQNIAPTDVSTVAAGRDITYTGFWNAGGLQAAGPGFFTVQAGRDLGPFLPLAHDTTGEASIQGGIASVGNASLVPVGNQYISNGGSVGLYDPALLGPFANAIKERNGLLSSSGADIVAQFGVAKGANYAALISTYIDPANAAKVPHNYLVELQDFLTRLGVATPDGAWTAFKALSEDLQHVFADQVFFAELKAVGDPTSVSFQKSQRGYEAVNTLFPPSLGYTANALGGGSNGAAQPVATGDLDLLHATIQTQHGGNVSIFGPGGSILVGSLATEPNTNLKLSDLGILTLGGGNINTFTDASVLVNTSRVLTTQGGNILMWSSNGNLDAGRGARTTLSLPPLRALFDGDDNQTIDLGGLVTGAGIGVLKTSSVALPSDIFLLAPHGTIDAGDAGLRASGNITVLAPVVLNAGNIQAAGTVTGAPVVAAPNVGALTAASSTAGAAAKTADLPTNSVGDGNRGSIFIIEVTGYGGPDGQDEPPPDESKEREKEKAKRAQ
jgi:filamentous hemagglutinin family protein